ncbi:MAG: biopolymer transporter ExbD [Myxococcales bacterium]|nr:biopolymer transporter ExbD [Myxococcales bacterium]
MPSNDDFEGDEGMGFTEPNIVPLVDIMLVLLVILMAGSSAIVSAGAADGVGSGFRVNLPAAAGEESVEAITDELVVTVLETGEVVIGEAALDQTDLEAFLVEQADLSPGRLVLIQADRSVVHSRVVEVMEIARRSGLSNLAIATRGSEPEE